MVRQHWEPLGPTSELGSRQDEEVGAGQGGKAAHEGEGGCGGERHVHRRVGEERREGSQRPDMQSESTRRALWGWVPAEHSGDSSGKAMAGAAHLPDIQSESTRRALWGWVPAEHSGDSSGKAMAGAAHLPWGPGPVAHIDSSTPSALVLLSRTDSSTVTRRFTRLLVPGGIQEDAG